LSVCGEKERGSSPPEKRSLRGKIQAIRIEGGRGSSFRDDWRASKQNQRSPPFEGGKRKTCGGMSTSKKKGGGDRKGKRFGDMSFGGKNRTQSCESGSTGLIKEEAESRKKNPRLKFRGIANVFSGRKSIQKVDHPVCSSTWRSIRERRKGKSNEGGDQIERKGTNAGGTKDGCDRVKGPGQQKRSQQKDLISARKG